MNLLTVITQLRTYATALGGRVAGAADFASGLESTQNLTMPCAFVLRLADDAEPDNSWPGANQTVMERMAIVVQFDNTVNSDADARTGFAGINQVDAMRANLLAAVMNWTPPDMTNVGPRGFQYAGGRLLEFDRARLFWQFEFDLGTLVSDADGFGIYGDPIVSSLGTIQPAANPNIGPGITIEFNV